MIEMLRNHVDPTQDDWDEHLTAASEFAMIYAYYVLVVGTIVRVVPGEHQDSSFYANL